MELNRRLFDCMADAAVGVMVKQVTIGLGYTAVCTSDNGIGIAATGIALADRCASDLTIDDFEGRPAADLLAGILSDDPMTRTMALALINALNHPATRTLPEDPQNHRILNHFGIFKGARVAMVGYFPPLVRLLESRQVPLSIIDDARSLGDKAVFQRQLQEWADVLLLTATSIINNTTESILDHAGATLKTVVLGPSTPMIPAAFKHLPVQMLAGTHISDPMQALKIVRHGGGTRALKPAGRKVCWHVDDDRKENKYR